MGKFLHYPVFYLENAPIKVCFFIYSFNVLVITFLTGQEEETTAAGKIPTIIGSGMNQHT